MVDRISTEAFLPINVPDMATVGNCLSIQLSISNIQESEWLVLSRHPSSGGGTNRISFNVAYH